MDTLPIDGLRVAFERAGEGPPLLLLHGILADSRVWRRQAADLSDEFTVVAWDAPGAGRSSDPPEPFEMADWADSLAALMDALELGEAHVLGLSWGGILAQELYRSHPARVRSLILADTYAGWRGSLGEALSTQRLETCLRESTLPASEFVPRWLPGLFTEAAPAELVDELTSVMSDFHPSGYRLMAGAAASDTRDVLPRIAVPTLLLWGGGPAVPDQRRRGDAGRDPGRAAGSDPRGRAREQHGAARPLQRRGAGFLRRGRRRAWAALALLGPHGYLDRLRVADHAERQTGHSRWDPLGRVARVEDLEGPVEDEP